MYCRCPFLIALCDPHLDQIQLLDIFLFNSMASDNPTYPKPIIAIDGFL